jgi:hypothetical protein
MNLYDFLDQLSFWQWIGLITLTSVVSHAFAAGTVAVLNGIKK